MKALIIITAVLATIGIAIYQFGFQKIEIKPGSVSLDEMTKTCDDPSFNDSRMTPNQAADMNIACKCMADASAVALSKEGGTTMIGWAADVQKNSAACMAKAGVRTE
jgi:hypothetical protein